MPVIGFLRSTSVADSTSFVTAFRQGLTEAGYVEGQNVAIEYRYAENDQDRLPALVADLIRRPVAVIVANIIAAVLAKAATTTVPIVFVTGSDPVQEGIVTSFNRPGGNVTGVFFFAGELGTKRLELFSQLVPKARTIAVLVNPDARTWMPRPTQSGSNFSFWKSAATATSRQLSGRLPNGGLVRCWSALGHSWRRTGNS